MRLWFYVISVVLFLSKATGIVHLTNQKRRNSFTDKNHILTVFEKPASHEEKSPVISSVRTHAIYLPEKISIVKFGEQIKFELAENMIITGSVESVTSTSIEQFVCSGTTENGGSFYLSYVEGAMVASVLLPEEGKKYELRLSDADTHMYTVKEIPRAIYDREDSPDTDAASEIEGPAAEARRAAFSNPSLLSSTATSMATATTDTRGILDVMFLFTPQALASTGNTPSAMNALVALSLQIGNDALRNSNAPLRMRSVGTFASKNTAYVEQSFDTELSRLRYDFDGYFDEDMKQRTALGADVVVLFVASTSYCGVAYLWATKDLALAVVSTQCPDSVSHEIGHTIGLHHDRVTAQDYDYSRYNFGYCWDTGPKSCYRSIMAYSSCVTTNRRTNCPRGLYFSSPLTTQGELGRTTGIATSDNVRVLREQASRAVNWLPSKTAGGMIFSVEPGYSVVGRCEAVTITGWSLGQSASDIVSVSINGIPVDKIISQSADSVQVLTALSSTPGTGDVVVTASNGYVTTLRSSFTYQAKEGDFTMDFESGSLNEFWESTGTLAWSVQRYCDSLPCSAKPQTGPSVGVGGRGNFAKAAAYDAIGSTAQMTARFSTHNTGCTELVSKLSLYYHMWGPQNSACKGELRVEMQSVQSSAWSTILTATTLQAQQDDPWLPLEYTFPAPADVLALRITAVPYTGISSCFYWGSVSLDNVTVSKTTTCAYDNCDLVSAHPTYALTSAPSRQPSTIRPTTAHPTSAAPTRIPTPAPSLPLVPAKEIVKFNCSQTVAGLTAAQFRSGAGNVDRFLRVAAQALNVSRSAVSRLSVTDLLPAPPSRRLSSHTDQSAQMEASLPPLELLELAHQATVPLSAGTGVRLTYEVTLVVSRMVDGDAATLNPSLSADALKVFNQTTWSLILNVGSGQFGSNLLVSLTGDVTSMQVQPISQGDFTEPSSFVYLESAAPTLAPTILDSDLLSGGLITWNTASYIIVAVIGVVVGILSYALWWCLGPDIKAWMELKMDTVGTRGNNTGDGNGGGEPPQRDYSDFLNAGPAGCDQEEEQEETPVAVPMAPNGFVLPTLINTGPDVGVHYAQIVSGRTPRSQASTPHSLPTPSSGSCIGIYHPLDPRSSASTPRHGLMLAPTPRNAGHRRTPTHSGRFDEEMGMLRSDRPMSGSYSSTNFPTEGSMFPAVIPLTQANLLAISPRAATTTAVATATAIGETNLPARTPRASAATPRAATTTTGGGTTGTVGLERQVSLPMANFLRPPAILINENVVSNTSGSRQPTPNSVIQLHSANVDTTQVHTTREGDTPRNLPILVNTHSNSDRAVGTGTGIIPRSSRSHSQSVASSSKGRPNGSAGTSSTGESDGEDGVLHPHTTTTTTNPTAVLRSQSVELDHNAPPRRFIPMQSIIEANFQRSPGGVTVMGSGDFAMSSSGDDRGCGGGGTVGVAVPAKSISEEEVGLSRHVSTLRSAAATTAEPSQPPVQSVSVDGVTTATARPTAITTGRVRSLDRATPAAAATRIGSDGSTPGSPARIGLSGAPMHPTSTGSPGGHLLRQVLRASSDRSCSVSTDPAPEEGPSVAPADTSTSAISGNFMRPPPLNMSILTTKVVKATPRSSNSLLRPPSGASSSSSASATPTTTTAMAGTPQSMRGHSRTSSEIIDSPSYAHSRTSSGTLDPPSLIVEASSRGHSRTSSGVLEPPSRGHSRASSGVLEPPSRGHSRTSSGVLEPPSRGHSRASSGVLEPPSRGHSRTSSGVLEPPSRGHSRASSGVLEPPSQGHSRTSSGVLEPPSRGHSRASSSASELYPRSASLESPSGAAAVRLRPTGMTQSEKHAPLERTFPANSSTPRSLHLRSRSDNDMPTAPRPPRSPVHSALTTAAAAVPHTTTTTTTTAQQYANNSENASTLDPKLSYTYSDSSAGGGFGLTIHCTNSSSSGSSKSTPTASVKKAVKSIEAALASKPNSSHNLISPISSPKHTTDTNTNREVSPPPPTAVLN